MVIKNDYDFELPLFDDGANDGNATNADQSVEDIEQEFRNHVKSKCDLATVTANNEWNDVPFEVLAQKFREIAQSIDIGLELLKKTRR